MNRIVCTGFAAAVVIAGGTACGSETTDLGSLRVTTTFDVGAGSLPDVTSDPTTNKAYVTSTGNDSLNVFDSESRTPTIKGGKAPGFVAVDPQGR